MKISGNTVLIAGGTSGIGLELARSLHAAGNTVIVAGRRDDALAQIEAENAGIEGVQFDITDTASIQRLFDTVTTAHPELNVLVTMAGAMPMEDVLDPESLQGAETAVETNVLGTIRLVYVFAPFLTGRPEATILTVSSGLAYVPLVPAPTYSASKAAVHAFTESLRHQLQGTSVQVVELVPPLVGTGMMKGNPIAMPVEEFVAEVMGLIESEPEARQILVDRVKLQRFAEVTGDYDKVFAMQAGPAAG